MDPDYKRWTRTQQVGGTKHRRIAAFRVAVERVHRKQLDGVALSAADYTELAHLGAMMHRQGDYYARPEEVCAAVQTVLDQVGHTVSSG